MNLSYKTIERFLQKDLPEREMEAIERHLKKDMLDAEMVANVADALQAGMTIDDLKQSENQFKRSVGLPKQQKRQKAVLRLARVAVVIVFLALPTYFFFSGSNSNKELYLTYFKPYNDMITTRGEDEVIKAMEYYNQLQYQMAIPVFEEEMAQNNDPLLHLYYGISLMQTGEVATAAKTLEEKAHQLKDDLLQEPYLWYSGLAYLANEESTKAHMQFQKLLNASTYYQEKAKAILAEMD